MHRICDQIKPGYLKAHIMVYATYIPGRWGCHISSLCCMYVCTYIHTRNALLYSNFNTLEHFHLPRLASPRAVFAPPSLARRPQLSPPFFFPTPRGFQHSLLCRLHCSPPPRKRLCASSSRKGAPPPPPPPPTLLSEFPWLLVAAAGISTSLRPSSC